MKIKRYKEEKEWGLARGRNNSKADKSASQKNRYRKDGNIVLQ